MGVNLETEYTESPGIWLGYGLFPQASHVKNLVLNVIVLKDIGTIGKGRLLQVMWAVGAL